MQILNIFHGNVLKFSFNEQNIIYQYFRLYVDWVFNKYFLSLLGRIQKLFIIRKHKAYFKLHIKNIYIRKYPLHFKHVYKRLIKLKK